MMNSSQHAVRIKNMYSKRNNAMENIMKYKMNVVEQETNLL